MDELEAHFKVSTIAATKTIVDALIDAACGEDGCQEARTIKTNITLEAIASYNSEGTKEYTLQTIFHTYNAGGVNTTAKSNFDSVLAEWEDVITDSNMYDSVNSVEGNVVASPSDFVDVDSVVYDSGNPTTIAAGGSVAITVTLGCAPFTWEAAEDGFSFTEVETTGRTNALEAAGDASGPVTITITDGNGNIAVGYVRCTTGSWHGCAGRTQGGCCNQGCEDGEDYYPDAIHKFVFNCGGRGGIYGTTYWSGVCSGDTYEIYSTRCPTSGWKMCSINLYEWVS